MGGESVRRVVENAFKILVSRFRVLPGTMEQRSSVVRDIVFTCVNDVAALQNKQVVYVPDDKYRNPLREAKHQQDVLKDYLNHVGALAGHGHDKICQPTPLGAEQAFIH